MLKIMILLLTIFLSSCNMLSGVKKKIICKELKRNEIKPMIMCDLAFKPKKRCRCRCFDVGRFELANDAWCDTDDVRFETGNYPVETCAKLSGFYLKDWAVELAPKIKRANKIKNNICK